MSAYLLTFNPDIYSNNEDKTLIYAVGDKDTWACYSQQPKLGDTVYLMRLGVNPKGIIAKGTITKESFSKEHWSDASKQITVIEFVVDDFRPNCEQGLLPLMLLNLAIENYNWCPQRSGLVIDPVSHEQLVSLWNDGQSKHSLTQYLSWYMANEHDTEDWYRAYKETCQQVADIKQGRAITEADLKKIWSDSSNGIAGVGQGVMSESDFNKNIDFLRQETAAIISLPTEQTYENTIKGWKNKAKFDRCLWSVINRAFAAAAPETYTSVVYDVYFQKILNTLKEQYQIDVLKAGSWLTQNKALLHKISRLIPADMDIYQRNIALWSLQDNKVTSSEGEGNQVAEGGKEYPAEVLESVVMPTNKILYGPPGTGKTYSSIDAAVRAAEPDFVWSAREELKNKYDQLTAEKRIRFVTFHQSYGYEDFVEGVKATTEDGQIHYSVEPGVFKKIAQSASVKNMAQNTASQVYDLAGRKIWKMSLGESQNDEGDIIFNECFENNYILLGYGDAIDFSGCNSVSKIKEKYIEEGYELKPHDFRVTVVNTFVNKISRGDIVVVSDGNNKFKAIAEVTSDYNFLDDDRDGFFQKRDVKWLIVFQPSSPVDSLFYKALSQPTLYQLKDSVISRQKLAELLNETKQKLATPKNFVLIIDEINRGNISKIFGELITLIEPSKRMHAEEALELVLPYSGEKFIVPSNLHIIGTMNTADRSLALIDTALRRRFEFVEMMPNYSKLDIEVKGVHLGRLLEMMNERIEILYDREHTLGHAFFMPVKKIIKAGDQDAAFVELHKVFKNKVLPLLQEYFFEDWQKIRLVLGDNQRDETLQFISEQELSNDALAQLFGSEHGLNRFGDMPKRYYLKPDDDDVWMMPEAYQSIYIQQAINTEADKA